MSFPVRFTTLLAAALFSCVVAIPFQLVRNDGEPTFALEMEITTDHQASPQIYFDPGTGISETNSSRAVVPSGSDFTRIRLALPAGILQSLRFDPIERPGRVGFRHAQIVDDGGRIVHRLAPADFTAQQQIAQLNIDGETVWVTTTPAANDPILNVALSKRLVLDQHFPLPSLVRTALAIFGVMVALLLGAGWLPASRRALAAQLFASFVNWFAARPVTAVTAIALLATVLSSYPVVFLGRSFVSPNFSDGTFLLYDRFPTLPGSDDAVMEDGVGSDVGAIIWQQVPYSFIQHRALTTDHELPLWNRYNSAGTVLLGQGQSMFGDPLHLPVILAGGAAWAWDLKYLAAKWLLCLGLGLTVLRVTRHLAAAVVTTLSAAFFGFFLYRLNHPAFFSFCYSPWILYAWVRISEAPQRRSLLGWCALLLLASVCELHSGTAKEAYMLLLSLHTAGVLVVLFAQRPIRERLLLLAAGAWTGALFVLLSAPTWLTFLDALKDAYTAYNAPTAFQLLPSEALGFFDELFYRPLMRHERVFNPAANGIVLLGLLYFLAAFPHAAASRAAKALAWSATLPAALVFGVIPPHWITRVPFVANIAHIDNTFSCVLLILVAVLAGFGWKAAFDRLGTAEAGRDLRCLAVWLLLLVVPWIALAHTIHRPIFGADTYTLAFGRPMPVSDFIWGFLAALLLALATILLTLRSTLSQRRITAAGVLLLGLACATLLWRQGMHARVVGPPPYVFTPAARANFHAPSAAASAIQSDSHDPARVIGLGNNLFPGWTTTYGLECVAGADGLINPRYRELIDALGIERIWDWRIAVTADQLPSTRPALDFLNVRYYGASENDRAQLERSLETVTRADLDVYRSPTAWPRAFVVNRVGVYLDPLEIGTQLHADGRPFAMVHRADVQKSPELTSLARASSAQAATPQPARDYRLTTNRTAFTVDTSGPGLAVLHEAWLRGDFRAYVNDKPVPYFRVNHAFKGVYLPAAGTYRVEFRYWPRRFTLALGASALGTVLGLVSVGLSLRAHRAAPSHSNQLPATGSR